MDVDGRTAVAPAPASPRTTTDVVRVDALAPATRQPHSVSLKLRTINIAAVAIPFAGFIAAIVLLWGVAFNWTYLAVLVGMYIATAGGVTVGFHRYFAHRSFKTSRPVVAVLGILGSMALQGPILQWVGVHRSHHHHSDHEDDPHTPHGHGNDLLGVIRGMWHSHVGWLFGPSARGLSRYVRDLRQDKLICRLHKLFPIWVLAGLLLPAVIAGLVTWSWMGVLLGFIWGGLARIFLVHHVTWSINSVCHIWGTQPYDNKDESRNNAIFGVLALGEGWHNNHHAFPTSARHGLRWWQFDGTYMIIWMMSKVGLARDVRVPARHRIMSKLADARPLVGESLRHSPPGDPAG